MINQEQEFLTLVNNNPAAAIQLADDFAETAISTGCYDVARYWIKRREEARHMKNALDVITDVKATAPEETLPAEGVVYEPWPIADGMALSDEE